MADRLSIYNEALRLIGEQPLSALTDDVPSRYTLDEAWEDVVYDGLSRGIWNFALRTGAFQHDASITPAIGYAYAIPKPDDWLFTVSASEYPDLQDYFPANQEVIKDLNGAWHLDSPTLYVEYATTDAAEDAAISGWSRLFIRFIASSLALDIANRLTQSTTTIQQLTAEVRKRLLLAKSRDARDEKEQRVRPGQWVRSQRGYGARFNRERSSVGGAVVTRQGNV